MPIKRKKKCILQLPLHVGSIITFLDGIPQTTGTLNRIFAFTKSKSV